MARMTPGQCRELIDYLRVVHGFGTQSAIARELGCTTATVCGWMHGKPIGRELSRRLDALAASLAMRAARTDDDRPACPS